MDQIMETTNVAEALSEEERNDIGSSVVSAVERDEESRGPWLESNTQYLKMALQVAEKKSFPWPNASNVKYPLITIAALQFQARAMPNILGDGKGVVKGKVVGYDPAGIKAEKAERIGKHMSFQLLEEIRNWEPDMDKLTLILPICGTVFKKVYWDDFNQKQAIDLILPEDVIINYWAKSLESARRITHKYSLYKNEIVSRQRDGKYREVDLGEPQVHAMSHSKDTMEKKTPAVADPKDVPFEIYEVHTYWDMDGDGYEEPWIFTIEKNSRELLRATPNWDVESIRKNGKGDVVEIKPKQYFVKYGFIPSPDGGFYDAGFGLLLGSLNETASTTINQLLDAGTMATTGGGFIGKGVKLRGGVQSFAPNEWKQVAFAGDDLKKNIFPLPVREPSPVLLSLLQLISAAGKEIISISEISTGKLPGQNTPATTTLTSIEEGLKLFNSIYKRIWRAEKEELRLLFDLNKKYTKDEEYFTILDEKEGQTFTGKVSRIEDYNSKSLDVIPVADPNTATDSARLIKAQQLIELIPTGAVNPAVAGQRVLQALDIPRPQELAPQPQPDPKAQAVQMKAQADMAKSQQDAQIEREKFQMEAMMKQMEFKLDLFMKQMDIQEKQRESKIKSFEAFMDLQKNTHEKRLEAAAIEHKARVDADKRESDLNFHKEKLSIKKEELKNGGKQGGTSPNK